MSRPTLLTDIRRDHRLFFQISPRGAEALTRLAVSLVLFLSLVTAVSDIAYGQSSWPLYSYDLSNTNHNPLEKKLSAVTAPHLKIAWSTFNDSQLSSEPAPTGFALESVLGLYFPSPVVGVTASPIIVDGTIYYVDQLGTVFARDAKTGNATSNTHWTTTLVDPDYDNGSPPVAPELFYTSPVVTDTHIWLVGSFYGRVHVLDRATGQELDLDAGTPGIDPFTLISDFVFSSVLGDPVIVEADEKTILVVSVNVIVNDAVVQGGEAGVQIAFDVSNPTAPSELWRRFSIDIDPVTGLRYGTGVSIGAGLAVDLERNLIFGGTGQNTSVPYEGYPDPALAPEGYVDRSDSLYAIDLLTGEFVWHNQFHQGDVFDLTAPVSTAPNQPNGPRDADVLSPPVLWTAGGEDMVGVGSKGGLYRAANRATGATVWERQISKASGIGGIQAGSAFADGVIYVAGFEGLDDGFSDAQFGTSFATGLYGNAFFATFSPAFWADVEDVSEDDDPATGMRIKLYALDAATGDSLWDINGDDFLELRAGAALRHVSVANDLIYVTTSAGKIFVVDKFGTMLFEDQTTDLNAALNLGLDKPHHGGMNTGVLISDGMVFTGYGLQNNPSGGIIAYKLDEIPASVALLESSQAQVQAILDETSNQSEQSALQQVNRLLGRTIWTTQQGFTGITTVRLEHVLPVKLNIAVSFGALSHDQAAQIMENAECVVELLNP